MIYCNIKNIFSFNNILNFPCHKNLNKYLQKNAEMIFETFFNRGFSMYQKQFEKYTQYQTV